MSVLSDYFSAPSDEAAASMVTELLSESSHDVVEMKGIFPDYHLLPVEAFLTGRSAEEVRTGRRNGNLLASADDDQVVVVTVSDDLTASLAAATGEQIAEAALSWSSFEDFQGLDTSGLAGFLGDLAGLAQRATARKERLYCKICCLRADFDGAHRAVAPDSTSHRPAGRTRPGRLGVLNVTEIVIDAAPDRRIFASLVSGS
jgi:hypothetical protein